MEVEDCQGDLKAASSFFSESCAPGLCEFCSRKAVAKAQGSVARTVLDVMTPANLILTVHACPLRQRSLKRTFGFFFVCYIHVVLQRAKLSLQVHCTKTTILRVMAPCRICVRCALGQERTIVNATVMSRTTITTEHSGDKFCNEISFNEEFSRLLADSCRCPNKGTFFFVFSDVWWKTKVMWHL